MNLKAVEQARFERTMRRLDEENSKDPNRVQSDGEDLSRELLYSQWVSNWVLRLSPQASEELRLAARAAHLCRWSIPRESFPANRGGYLRWREELKKLHADKTGAILQEAGYEQRQIDRVRTLISKKAFPADPESRVLEDALCLVFLEHQFAELAQKSSDDKMINALRKTWLKMTPAAHEQALKLQYNPREKQLLEQALSDQVKEQRPGTGSPGDHSERD